MSAPLHAPGCGSAGLYRRGCHCAECEAAEANRKRRGERAAQLLDCLATGPKHLHEIRDLLGVTSAGANMLAHRAIRKGTVTRIERGVYALAERGVVWNQATGRFE